MQNSPNYTMDQPVDTGTLQHGTITEPQQPTMQPLMTPRFEMAKGGDVASKEEAEFQKGIKQTGWYKEYKKEYGEEPDLDITDYDYRKAWKAGVRPERDPYDNNRYHWGSSDPETGEMLKSKDHPTAWKEDYMRKTGENPDAVGITKEQAGMAKGGQVRSQTQRMLKEGGMMQEGGTVDPESGNKVPFGAMQEEVRDDIPAQLSEGEFVFPADVVRYIGLERLMMMRQAAKKGLMQMEDMGQMSNGEDGTEEEDTAEFESQIDEIIGVLGGREPGEKEDVEMAEGGMVEQPMQAPAMAQTQQALSQDQQPQNAALTEDQLNAINRTVEGMKSQQMEVPPEKQSKPTEGLTSADIIRQDASKNKDPAKVEAFLEKINKLAIAKRALVIRHNDTVTVGFIKPNGAVDPLVFTKDTPDRIGEAAEAMLFAAKKAGIKRIESNANADTNIAIFNKLGYPAKKEDPATGIAWSLDLE